MIRKFAIVAFLVLASFGLHAGVKVTSVDLKTSGKTGTIFISVDGHSRELPDIRVSGNTISVELQDADSFRAISKKIRGALLTANPLNGKAIVKIVLPYDVSSKSVTLNLKKNNIEVVFPRAQVARTQMRRFETKKENIPKVVETSIVKEKLDESYLDKLMKEETKTVVKSEVKKIPAFELKKDEVKLKQSAAEVSESQTSTDTSKDSFSFAGYAAKFIVFLALVLGLFYGIVQLLKKGVFSRGKLGFLNNAQMIQVLSTTYVAPKRSLMVVKAHNQIFLVANSENGIQFLSEMKDTTGLIKEGEKLVTGTNFDLNLGNAETNTTETSFKLKENINESEPILDKKGIQSLSGKDIVKFSDELKKKAKKLKPIEFN